MVLGSNEPHQAVNPFSYMKTLHRLQTLLVGKVVITIETARMIIYDDIKTDKNSQILEAIRSVIIEKILPSIQNKARENV